MASFRGFKRLTVDEKTVEAWPVAGAVSSGSQHHQRQLAEDAASTYDEMADDYDRHLQEDCGYRSPSRVARVLADLPVSGRWVDLGAGTGLLGSALERYKLDVSLIAVDVSSSMLEQISCPLYVKTYHADVLRKRPVKRHSCVGVAAVGLLEYVVDTQRLFGRVAEMLEVEGLFALTFCPNRAGEVQMFDDEADLHSHDAALIERELLDVGFELIHRSSFRAYINGEQGWVRHRLVIGRWRGWPS